VISNRPLHADFADHRRLRRALVIAILIGTGVLASALPPSLDGFGLIPVLLLATLALMLIRSTRGLAFARGESLDERERALRDLAYRVGFRWLGLAVAFLLIITIFSAIAATLLFPVIGARSFPSDLSSGITGRGLFAVLEFLCIVPTMVIAWNQSDGPDQSDRTQPAVRPRRRALSLMWLVLPGMFTLWVLDITLVPVQAASRNPNFSSSAGESGAKCQEFVSGRVVGGPFGATVGLDAIVCWNGTEASLGNAPIFQYCSSNTNDDFAGVAETCSASTDSHGTLHYVVRARVSPLPFSIGARDITLTLAVARDGTVITQP
jgi:hypothetical protein